MKRLMIATVLCALALSGCGVRAVNSTPNPATAPVGSIADTVIMTSARAFGLAELGYTVAADAIAIPVNAGLIRGATATRVRALNAEGRALLVRGKSVTDLAEKARIAARLFDIRDALNLIKGGN